jgi:phenylpropionate dioxygenase-like ring-hydroxylating dioxygenase large terminal subunit
MNPSSTPSDPANEATLLRNFWYPVAQSSALGKKPIERKVAEQRIVLFRDLNGKANALDARCPHRGANLAQGQVRNGCITCPFHGWAFNGSGQCVSIPSQPASTTVPTKYVTKSFGVIEQQGLIWVNMAGAACVTQPPRFPGLADASLHAFTVEELVPIPFDWWVENIIDVSHVPIAHQVTRHDDELGFSAHAITRHNYPMLTRLLHGSLDDFSMDIHVEHFMPGNTVFNVDMGRGKRQQLIFLATPEDTKTTRIWIIVLRNYFLVPGGDLIGRLFTKWVVREDLQIARRAVTRISLAMPERFNCAVDAPALEFLRLLQLWRDRENSSSSSLEKHHG